MKRRLIPAALVLSQVLTSCSHNPITPSKSTVRMPSSEIESDAKLAKDCKPYEKTSGSPWTTWSDKSLIPALIELKGMRERLFECNLRDPHLDYTGYREVDCSKTNTQFRSADGTCNDLREGKELVGAAGVAFGRNVDRSFIDQNAAEKLMTPNPAEVSKEFFTRDQFKPVPFLNMLAAVWIQFMNHDWLTHGRNMEADPHKVELADGGEKSVDRTKENPVDSSHYKSGYDKVSLNDVTHWWDASQIYGSNQADQNNLRTFSNGKMKMVKTNGRDLLPKTDKLNVTDNKQNQGYEVTGFKDNWWVGLSMLHTLFVEEHNSIAEMLYAKHTTFDAKTGMYTWKNGEEVKTMTAAEIDEQIFQVARLINAAVLAKIHTVEWTPAILPNKTLKTAMYINWYGGINPRTWAPKGLNNLLGKIGLNKADWFTATKSGYLIGGVVGDKANDFKVPYNISEEFTSVYRLHSLLPEKLEFRTLANNTKVNAVDFADTRNEKSYPIMESNDLKDLYYSFGVQHPGQLVLNNFPAFMQNLTIPGHGTMDLGMVDIMRDRERGVPRYNQFRRAIGLKPISTYRDFFPRGKELDDRQKKLIQKFYKVYGKTEDGLDNVEAIDLLVGTLGEEVRPKNYGFGETQFQIFILMASRRLMSDRFFTDNYNAKYYTQDGIDWVDTHGVFADVIGRHMPELKPHLEGIETAFNPWKP
jgi:hypothetical protein